MNPQADYEYINIRLHAAELEGLGTPRVKLKDGRIVEGSFLAIDENEHGVAIAIHYLIPGELGPGFMPAKPIPEPKRAVKKAQFEALLKDRRRHVKKAEFEAWLKDRDFIFQI